MAEAKAFTPAKLIIGVIAAEPEVFALAEKALVSLHGLTDLRSSPFPFDTTDYYEADMGPGLRRVFLSFADLVPPYELAAIKIRTNDLEGEIGRAFPGRRRAVNIDPGILTGSALIMATAKNFAHRVPLTLGIYAHLELLFKKKGVSCLDWTYPDFRRREYQDFFLAVRGLYLDQPRGDREP